MIRFRYAANTLGLSFPVILISGITAAFFLLIGFLLIRRINTEWSPTVKTAQQLLKKKKYAEALAVIEKAEENQENNTSLLIEKGKVWFSLALEREKRTRWSSYGTDENDWLKSAEAEKAEEFLKKAVQQSPNNKDAHYFLGQLYMEKGWFSLAEIEFLAVLRDDKENVKALLNLGVVYAEMKRFDLAQQELRHALRIDRKEPAIAKNFAYLYRFYLDKPDSAIAWANRYLNLDPKNDLDITFVRKELEEMLQRYPEFTPKEPMTWKKPPLFKSRFGNK